MGNSLFCCGARDSKDSDVKLSKFMLSENQLMELRKAFDVIDANKDGFVSKEELKTLL